MLILGKRHCKSLISFAACISSRLIVSPLIDRKVLQVTGKVKKWYQSLWYVWFNMEHFTKSIMIFVIKSDTYQIW